MMTNRYFALIQTLLLVICIAGIGCGKTVFAYSALDIDNNIPGGRNTVIGWEQNLFNILSSCRNGKNYQGKRTCINYSAYAGPFLFLMDGAHYADGLHSGNVITVDAGTKEVPLRFKGILFYSASMVNTDNTADYGYDSQFIVRSDNFPNDRSTVAPCQKIPGGYYGNINCPALTMSRFRVTRAWSDDVAVNVTQPSGGGYMELGINNSGSRYQFTGDSFISVKSNSSAGFTQTKDVNIYYDYRSARQYYSSFANYPTSNNGCFPDGTGGKIAFGNFDACKTVTGVATIKIKVRGPNIEGRATVDNATKKSAAGTDIDKDGKGYSYTEYNGVRTQVNHPQDATITEVRPTNKLSWWFNAKNKGKGPTLDSFDLMSYRKGWGDSEWDIEPYDPANMARSNWFRIRIKDGEEKRFGCYDWGSTCVFRKGSVDSSADGELMTISELDATNKYHYVYTVKPSDAHKTLCQRLRWSWLEDNWVENKTPYACAAVPFHYPPEKCKNAGGTADCDNGGDELKDCNFKGTCPTPGTPGNYPTEYAVKPSVSGNGEAHIGDNVTFNYGVKHATTFDKATKSTTMNYTKYNFVLSGDSAAAQNISNGELANPEAYPSFDAVNVCGGDGSHRGIDHSALRSGTPCNVVSGNIDQMMPSDIKNIDDPSFDKVSLVGNYLNALPGDKVCSFVAINRWAAVNDDIAPSVNASPVTCFLITKSPSLQLTGSDAKAGGDFAGSSYSVANTIAGNENRGSYSQLANISNGNISEFGSNNHTTILDKGGVSNLSCKLDFANVTGLTGRCNSSNLSALGRFSNGATGSSSYEPLLPTKPSSTTTLSGNINLNSLSDTKAYAVSGNATIAGALNIDTHATIYVSGDVAIGGNITYADTTFGQTVSTKSAVNRIPSLTIVSENGNITVNDGATVVNANLVAANGRVITCAGGSSNSNLGVIGSCNRKLQINGGIVSKGSPKFLRTFGSGNSGDYYDQWAPVPNGDTAMSASSEWINYTPNVWLTPYTNSHPMSGITDFKTTKIDELPARL